MDASPIHRPRAVGRRLGYERLPARVREWVTAQFGPVRLVREHVAGMSPGCATSLRAADGQHLFVKAVGAELNEQTVELFQYEVGLLRALPPAPHRPVLRAAYDEGGWVAIVLEHVPGRHPDLARDNDFAAVARVVTAQAAELTPAPVAATNLTVTAERWLHRWEGMREQPERFLPGWAVGRFDDLIERVRALPRLLPATTLCHFDIRDDNLLVRDDGQAVVLDWGMARHGPSWTDPVLLATQRHTAEAAEYWLRRWVPPADQDTVTGVLVALAGSQAWSAQQPAKPALPTLPDFCREDARRYLALVRLRLGA